MSNDGVNILLASYNGEKFIAAQIDSIVNQTHQNWQLYIRDDGSTDNTLKIIREYERKFAGIHVINDNYGNVGSCQNFSLLTTSVKNGNEYTMFCDQDDVWMPGKIEITLKEMLNAEKLYGKDYPLLVHTNFLYADEKLKPIKSKENFQPNKTRTELANLLCQNHVKGCTQLINKKLLDLVGADPPAAENHDYWVALVASAFAKVIYINEKTMLYRQHGENISTQFNDDSFIKRFRRILIERKNFQDIESKRKMAFAFKEIYYDRLSTENKKVLDCFIEFFEYKTLSLIIRNVKNGIRRQTFSQTLLFYVTALLLKRNTFAKSTALLFIMFATL
ncbi:glycosyltransferase family 2 protein [Parafilimonas sp.]|uniref:glycosyltransferase family 2 protein n=1 Tax=Parafilimonas sp. TaxID=1969739 RepID=UPI0039E70399